MNEPRPTTISARPREMRSSVAKLWKTRTGSAALRTATALVKRMRLVRAAAAARITAGAESRNSLRWCSPMPNTSRPTSSACSISSSRSRRRSAGLTPLVVSPMAAAKLSTPTSISQLRTKTAAGLFPAVTDCRGRSVRLDHLRGRRIRSKDLLPLAAGAPQRQCLLGRPGRRVALEVEIEDVIPGRGAAGSRLDLAELEPRGCERLQRSHEGPGQVRGLVDEARLCRSRSELGRNPLSDLAVAALCEGEESREVVSRGLDGIGEDVEAIAPRGASARDGGDRRVSAFRDLRCRSGGIEGHLRFDPMLAKEFFDLRERLWMRARCPHVFEPRPGYREEAMTHAKDELGDDLRAVVLPQEVVDVSDGSRVCVFDGHDRGVDVTGLERREDLRERATREQARSRKERGGSRLRERTGETLVGDGGQRYTAVRHSGCRLSSPCAMPK